MLDTAARPAAAGPAAACRFKFTLAIMATADSALLSPLLSLENICRGGGGGGGAMADADVDLLFAVATKPLGAGWRNGGGDTRLGG